MSDNESKSFGRPCRRPGDIDRYRPKHIDNDHMGPGQPALASGSNLTTLGIPDRGLSRLTNASSLELPHSTLDYENSPNAAQHTANDIAHPDSTQLPQKSPDIGTSSPSTATIQLLQSFAQSIQVLSNAALKEEDARRQASHNAEDHQKQTAHAADLPILLEETKDRADKVELRHKDLEDQLRRASASQDRATAELASLMENSRVASKSVINDNQIPAPMTWENELEASKEEMTQTILKENADLRSELQDTKESLKSLKKQVHFYNEHGLTKEMLEKRLKDFSSELSNSDVFAAHQQTLHDSEQKYESALEMLNQKTSREITHSRELILHEFLKVTKSSDASVQSLKMEIDVLKAKMSEMVKEIETLQTQQTSRAPADSPCPSPQNGAEVANVATPDPGLKRPRADSSSDEDRPVSSVAAGRRGRALKRQRNVCSGL